jgi:RNA polymerase sigma factor (TIGR02999 family)
MQPMTLNAETSLIQRAKAGGVDAWEKLIVRYQFSLQDYIQCRYSHCLSAFVSPEDILQEALLQAWLDIKSLKQTTPSSFFAWLKAVADRRVCDTLKAQRRQKRGGQLRRATNSTVHAGSGWHDLLDALPAEAKTASSILSRKETARALQVAVSLLPDDQQTALRMHDLEGKTLGETADAMNRTSAAIRGLLHRGKQRLTHDLASISSWLGARSDVLRLLAQIESGDGRAADKLLILVHDELREIVYRQGQEQPGDMLKATAVIYEAFRRLVGTDRPRDCPSAGRFFVAAAEAMRRILIDRARKKQKQSHTLGCDLTRKSSDVLETATEGPFNLLRLDEALKMLAITEPLKAELVKLRYFAGLSTFQAAKALGISETTADRDWAFARNWLHTELNKDDDSGSR